MPPDVLDLFLELAALPSPPGEERLVADRVAAYLIELGLEVSEDDAGSQIGSNAGNLYSRLEPTADGGLPIFLCAHLDTVPFEGRLEPVVEDGVVRNSGGTILGADNKASVAAMLEGVRRLLDEGHRHAGVELVFTLQEEVGLVGAGAFEHERLRAHVGYVYDHAAPIGGILLGSPYAHKLEVSFHGRAAHSGIAPEEGRSAIVAASKAIADLRLGRLDEETTANVGTIQGGTGGNIVPEHCTFRGEVRSHEEGKLADVLQEMMDTIAFAAASAECEVETKVLRSFTGYRLRKDEPAVRLAAAALERAGHEPRFALGGGGADANVFNERGLRCVNIANGMTKIHTPDEEIAVADLEGMVEVTLALVDCAREDGA